MNTQMKALAAGGTALASLLYGALAFADPVPETSIWGLPRDASQDGHRIDWLINVTNIFVVLLFVVMCAWMAYAVAKHNEKHKAEYDHGDSKHHVAVAMGVSALIFFVVDGNLWFNSTIDVNTAFWNHAAAEKHPEAVLIELNAHQWAWDARYAGPDGKFNNADDVVTLNDIRVPKGVPIVFQIASADVIHSFYLPNFRVKQDAMPGMITRLWFVAKEAGEFDIGCAQHCGTHHYKMKGRLTVLEVDDYKRWHAEMSAQRARAFNPKDENAQWGWEWKSAGEGHATKDAAHGGEVKSGS